MECPAGGKEYTKGEAEDYQSDEDIEEEEGFESEETAESEHESGLRL